MSYSSGTTAREIRSMLFRNAGIYFRKFSARWFCKVPEKSEKEAMFVAADASAGYCRAALVTETGKITKLSLEPTKIRQSGVFHEMSTNEIWQAMVLCIKKLTENEDVSKIKGIGFIASSALVCLDGKGNPITASVSRDPNLNCILNYDQRSLLEAEKINLTRHALLQYFGDRILPELQESKLLWLKNNLREDCWDKAGHFIDLSDFLTWKATGSFLRSSSVLLSKWSYEITVNGNEGWNPGFFNEIGLPEITQDKFSKIGTNVQRPGTPIDNGLREEVAKVVGLPAGLPVATSMSDALAGGLGSIGCQVDDVDHDVTSRLCVVYGSRASAHFTLSHNPVFVKGVWGPFKDCILPGLWLNHAGQTTAESVMDYIIGRHPSVPEIKKRLGSMHIHKYLNKILKLKAQKQTLTARSYLTKNLHIVPDFDGNQSPLADPRIRGMISGLSLASTQESLALLYLATMQSLAYSTRHIVSTIAQHGHPIKSLIVGGDLGKNSLFMCLHKDVCQIPTISPDESRSKILGAAILGSVASNHFRNFSESIQAICGKGRVLMPDKDKDLIEFHNKKYQVFLKMYDHQLEYRRLMSSGDKKSNVLKI